MIVDDNGDQHDVEEKLYISCGAHVINRETDLHDWYTDFISAPIQAKFDEFEINGSGWTLAGIEGLIIYNNRYQMLRGSSYMQLSSYIARKKAIINVKNVNDNECFKWAVLSALHANEVTRDRERVQKYFRWQDELNFDGIEFPVALSSIKKFENQNVDISINVFMIEIVDGEEKVLPIRVTKEKKRNHIHLLLLQQFDESADADDDESNIFPAGIVLRTPKVCIKSHYVWIKDMSRLLSQQLTGAKQKLLRPLFALFL